MRKVSTVIASHSSARLTRIAVVMQPSGRVYHSCCVWAHIRYDRDMSFHEPHKSARRPRALWRDATEGVGIAWQGLRVWSSSPRMMAWGLIPGLVTALIYGVVGVIVLLQLKGWSQAIAEALGATGGWQRSVLQVVVALAILGGLALLAVYTFAAVTLTIGQPFFERISRTVDAQQGVEGSDPDEPWYRSFLRDLRDFGRLTVLSAGVGIGLFVVGLLPVAGTVAAFVLGACCGGYFLALELTSYPLARRGLVSLHERRVVLRERRATVVGFGFTVFVLFLVPGGAVIFMPAAVAGATTLVRDVSLKTTSS